jgi:hypothetical protein
MPNNFNPTAASLRFKVKYILAPLFSFAFVLSACLLFRFGGWSGWISLIASFGIAPGIHICRWFMPTHFAAQVTRLAIVGAVSALVYWPVMLFVIESILDRKRVRRSVTRKRVMAAFGIGILASLAVHKLYILSPSIFGILTVPADILLPFGVLIDARHLMHWWLTLQLVGGSISYGVIAFFILYRAVWRKSCAAGQT